MEKCLSINDEVYVINELGYDSGIYGIVVEYYFGGTKIAIDGNKSNVVKFENKFLRKKEKTYHVGQKFIKADSKEKYVLAEAFNNYVGLIDINDGCRWSEFIKVNNANKVTKEELKLIMGYSYFDFFDLIEKYTTNDYAWKYHRFNNTLTLSPVPSAGDS